MHDVYVFAVSYPGLSALCAVVGAVLAARFVMTIGRPL